jgi:hypothetical protein
MGNKENKNIKKFNNNKSYYDIVNSIERSGVNKDFNLLVFIDCSKSSNFVNGSTLHNISDNLPNINKNVITNYYILVMQVFKNFINLDYKSDIYLYFFGTEKANGKENKLSIVTDKYDIDKKEIINIHTNKVSDINELIDLYIGSMMILKSSKEDNFSENSSYIHIIEESINKVKKKNKYTISLIITDDTIQEKKILENIKSIMLSSNYPLSIICIGIDETDMTNLKNIDELTLNNFKQYKKELKKLKNTNKFDNFHLILLKDIIKTHIISDQLRNELYKNIFMEIAQQYEYIQRPDVLNYIKKPINNIKSSSFKTRNYIRYSLDNNYLKQKKITNRLSNKFNILELFSSDKNEILENK